MAEFTCIVNCSDFANWYVNNSTPRQKDIVTHDRDTPSPGLLTTKLQTEADYSDDVLITCITFDSTMNFIVTMPAVLHIIKGTYNNYAIIAQSYNFMYNYTKLGFA